MPPPKKTIRKATTEKRELMLSILKRFCRTEHNLVKPMMEKKNRYS